MAALSRAGVIMEQARRARFLRLVRAEAERKRRRIKALKRGGR